MTDCTTCGCAMDVHDEADGCVVHGWCGRAGTRTVPEADAERAAAEHAARFGVAGQAGCGP